MKPPLLIAESANPEWASVPLEGWSHSRAIQRLVGGHIVTQVRNRAAFERAGATADEFTAIDSEKVAAGLNTVGQKLTGGKGKGWTTLMAVSAPSYYYFERLVWKRFGNRLKAGEFSLVHRVTPLSPTIPSLLASKLRRIGVPFVWGPINGGVPWPAAFDRERRREREWLSYVRGAYRALPGYRASRRCAAALICGSRHTASEIAQPHQHKVVYIPENAFDPERFVERRTRRAEVPLRCVFLGRLVPYKGGDMLLEAAADLVKTGKLTIEFVGDGPERGRLESMARELGLGEAVKFLGLVPHTEVQKHLANADLMTFPSIREFGGAVILEAMAVGVVPMAVAYGGPAELMTETTAYPVEIGSREEVIARFRARLEEAVADPGGIDARSAAAQERARRLFTWDAKASQTREVYRWVLGERGDKPEFDFS
ncbi:MAG: glycosyltransferase family 4 protein [Planctomycetota bacterium]